MTKIEKEYKYYKKKNKMSVKRCNEAFNVDRYNITL